MNLQIELKRERREYEIAEKDRLAEIKSLQRMAELKESNAQKHFRAAIHSLQEQLRVKQDRYSWALNQLQVYHKSQGKVDEEAEIKMMSNFMSQTQPDPSTYFQDTIAALMLRLKELEHKPLPELEQLDLDATHEEHLNTISRLQGVKLFLKR